MVELLHEAARVLRPEQIWVNPDCGLKTRAWAEVEPSLRNMVAGGQAAARRARSRFLARIRAQLGVFANPINDPLAPC